MARLYAEAALTSFPGFLHTGEIVEFTLAPGGIVHHVLDTGNVSLQTDAWLIPDVCLKPAGIWRGLKRKGQDETLIYAGVPDAEFSSDRDQDIELVEGMTFLLFVTADFVVRKYRWEQVTPEGPAGYPINHATRFEEQLWPTQD